MLLKPARLALGLALGYLGLCGAYIVISGIWARAGAHSLEDLQRFETLKGLGFVILTALLLFVALLVLFRHIARQQQLLIDQRDTFVTVERRTISALLAASIGHDINNVLTACQGELTLLDRPDLSPQEFRAGIDALYQGTERLQALSRRLVDAERERTSGRMTRVDVAKVVGAAVTLAEGHSRVRTCTVTTTLTEPLVAYANPLTLERMLLNLVLNAADAQNGHGQIEIRLQRQGDDVLLEVHDSGPGIPPQQRERIFEPFYTTKLHGTGLGLLSVRIGAEEHGGRVGVDVSDLGGAVFRVTWPIEPRVHSAPETASSTA